jgi:hypothetical protein
MTSHDLGGPATFTYAGLGDGDAAVSMRVLETMRVPETEHTARPWRIHEIAPDFQVEGMWAFRTPGAGPDDFPAVLAALRAAGGLNENPPLVRIRHEHNTACAARYPEIAGSSQGHPTAMSRVVRLRDTNGEFR